VSRVLHASDLAPGLALGEGVELGEDVQLGTGVVIHGGTVVGSRCVVQDGAVLGKLAGLGPRSTAPADEPDPLGIEPDAVVCAGAIVYAGARIGAGAVVGDQAQVRERTAIGAESMIGRGSGLENDVRIGVGVRIQSSCYLAAHAVVEDDVFVGPGVVSTNDDTMGRHGSDHDLRGPVLKRACRIGGGVVLTPGVVVGEEAYIAAGAVVTRDVAPRSVVIGVPARAVREVPDADLLSAWR
jgi:acetyltransferase-like isoleucine patch superfamily enzyme